MLNSKIITLIKTFSQKELLAFESFVVSPFFNKNEALVKVLEIIIKEYPEFNREPLSKQKVFEKLYPDKVFDDKQIRYLLSDLLKLGYKFLMVRKIEEEPHEADLRLMDEFIERNLEKHYVQTRNRISVDLDNDLEIGLEHFYEKMKIADLEQKHFSRQQLRQFDDNIQHGSDFLNRYFVLKKLKYACGMLDRQSLLKGAYQLDLPENWMDWLIANHYWGEKIIKMYAMVFLSLENEENPAHFEQLKNLLHANISGIPLYDAKELFLYAINYCVRKMRMGEDYYIETALSLYLKGIQEKALMENGFLSPWTFGNVVKLALRLERYEWIEHFIEEHKYHLAPEFQENAMQYNLAELHCYKKDFDKALSFLFKVEFSDLSYHLGSRIMLSKIYFELNEKEALLSLMSSFIMFLKRNKKISESIRKTCLNFCDLLFLIIRGKTQQIEEKIKNTSLLADREWLLEKAAAVLTQRDEVKT